MGAKWAWRLRAKRRKEDTQSLMADSDRPDEQAGATEPMSLEQFSGALADLFGIGAPEAAGAAETEEASATGEPAVAAEDDEQDAVEVSPRSILEAMLFVGRPDNAPLTSRQVASLMRGVEPDEVDQLVEQLNAEYAAHGAPYEIVSVGAGYRLVLRESFYPIRDKLYGRVRQAKLSQAAVEVLAIVAYNQPITAEELNKLRGTASGAILSQLVRRQLLRLERPEQKPRTPRYYTTERFLELFGLASLQDLPRSQELDKQ